MERASDIRGRKGNNESPGLAGSVVLGLEEATLLPPLIPSCLDGFRVVLDNSQHILLGPWKYARTHSLEVRVIKRLYDLLQADRCLVLVRREGGSLCLWSRCGLLLLRLLLLLFQLGGLLLCCEFGSLLSSLLGSGLFFLLCPKILGNHVNHPVIPG